jgi:hypothetical protein
VRVWFGSHVLVDRTGELPEIARYYLGMKKRYASLLVTIEPTSQTEPTRTHPQEPSAD